MVMKKLCFIPLTTAWIAFLSLTAFADDTFSKKLSLSNVIEIALKNHPQIEATQARLEEASGRRQAAPSLPPPMVSYNSMGERGPYQGLMQATLEVSQRVPFPTKLTGESRVRSFEEKAAQSQIQAEKLAIQSAAKAAFFDLYRAREQIRLTEEKLRILENHLSRIRSIALSDRIIQSHIVQIQTEVELAKNELEKLRANEQVAQGSLNVSMGAEPDHSIPSLDEPPLTELPSGMKEQNAEEKISQHPTIQALHGTVEAFDASTRLAKSDWLPDFAFTFRRNWRYDNVMPSNYEFAVGIELPFLFFWQPNGKTAETSARLQETQAQVVQTTREFKLQLLKARVDAFNLRSRLTNYTKLILPQAEKRLKIAHSIAPTDMESINEHREAMESNIDLQIAALNVRVDYEKAVAEWEKLTSESK
jgi:cobalt-zinc-cadmium efflux system outer membrane protein